MGKKTDKNKNPAPVKDGKATGQEVKDPNTPKGVAPESETPMSVEEVNPSPAPQSASVNDTDIEMSPLSSRVNPLSSLEASTKQPELLTGPKITVDKQYEVGNLCHMFPDMAKFRFNPTKQDFDQLRLDYNASSRRSEIQKSSGTTKNMLTAQRARDASIDAHCCEITDECVGISPDFLVLLLESRTLLLRFLTFEKVEEPQLMEKYLLNLGLQAIIEGRVSPDENVRNSVKEFYGNLLRDRGASSKAVTVSQTCKELADQFERTLDDASVLTDVEYIFSAEHLGPIVQEGSETLLSTQELSSRTADLQASFEGVTPELKLAIASRLKPATDAMEGIARYAVAQRARQIMTTHCCVQQEIRSRKSIAPMCESTRALEAVTQQSGAYALALLAANEM